MATKLDSRQVVLRAQSPFIGNAANEQLDVVFPRIDAEMAKLYEDRNVMLQNGGIITFTGTQIQFTENLEIVLNQKISGAAPQVIDLGSANVDLADGEMWYAIIDRSAGTASTAVASTLPAVVAANQEVFLIVKRVDAGDGTQRIYWRSGMAMNAGQSNRLGASGSGGSGSGVGDDLGSLLFKASFTDGFDEGPTDVKSAVDTSAGFTDPTTYNAAKAMYTISYDASKTIAVGTTTTNIELSAVAAFTVKIGDIVIANGQARRITAVASQQSFTTEAFTTAPTLASQVTVSQAIYSKDLNNFAVDGLPISDAFSTTISQILLTYEDTTASGDNIFDANTVAVIGYSASSDNSSFTDVSIRPQYLDDTQLVKVLPTASTSLYLRFFANQTSGSGTVNLLGYKAFLHKFQASEDGAILNQAYGRTDGTGTDVSVAAVTVVGGKTRIRVDWAYPVGVNPGKANGSLVVYLDGQKIPRFVDATVSISAYYTEIDQNTIELDADYSSLALEFEVVQSVAVVDASDTNSTGVAQLQETISEGTQGFVKTSAVLNATTNTGTPAVGTFHSTIQNRAAIADLTQDLKARMGIERIPTTQIYQIQNEFGPNGESVWGLLNDVFGQVRFVGNWSQAFGTNGTPIGSTLVNDFVEITFYGTGLNVLAGSETARDMRASVDGGAEGSNLMVTQSSVIYARNYGANVVVNAVSNLALGIHTVKLRVNTSAGNFIWGLEVLNESSSIKVNPGSSYLAGKKITSSAQSSIAYNSSFESGSLGVRGGRVAVYQKADGTIAKSVTPVNASQLNLTSADHTNEEIARVYHFREFGAGRTDDFSRVAPGSAQTCTFTLEDGSTSLIGTSATRFQTNSGSEEGIFPDGVGEYIAFTFTGTGLDIYNPATTATANTYNVTVDGVSIASGSTLGGTSRKIVKIVSGLPYGTHTVRISCATTGLPALQISRFFVYQPKKPTVPAGAVELADYNVMADFIASVTSTNGDFRSTGVLAKASGREFTYVGTWSIDSAATGSTISGSLVSSSTASNYMEYTFFGTGINLLARSGGVASTATIQIDGVAYTGAATAIGTGSSWTPGTSTFTMGAAAQDGTALQISGLSLGLHKIRVTVATNNVRIAGVEVITPIHSAKSDLSTDYQSTLSVGSNAISDNRKITALKDISAQNKNISQAIGITSNPTTTSTSLVPMPDMSVTHTNKTGRVKVSYSVAVANTGAGAGTSTQIYVDGVVSSVLKVMANGGSYGSIVSDSFVVNVSPGTHKYDIYWACDSGTSTAQLTRRNITVEEI